MIVYTIFVVAIGILSIIIWIFSGRDLIFLLDKFNSLLNRIK